MAANQSRFMCGSFYRAGRMKMHSRPPTATRRRKSYSRLLTRRSASLNSSIDLIYLKFLFFIRRFVSWLTGATASLPYGDADGCALEGQRCACP
jgi:hypothetical protein